MNTRNQFGSIPRHSGQRGQDTSRHWSETFESKSKFHSDIVGLSIGTPHLPATPLDIVLSQKYLKTGLTGRRRRGSTENLEGWKEGARTSVRPFFRSAGPRIDPEQTKPTEDEELGCRDGGIGGDGVVWCCCYGRFRMEEDLRERWLKYKRYDGCHEGSSQRRVQKSLMPY
ncbi:hypothetical protein HZH68_010260 [Vespula germanica]|uniref:Uncharacterized protein n=1 Tax=Vespula germanica TaxID=30212 RepID=A0A834JS40_VESGE|nr:hypothetical protein HZH68_010260 [Vespula germanica]